jgi:hypothetical protein
MQYVNWEHTAHKNDSIQTHYSDATTVLSTKEKESPMTRPLGRLTHKTLALLVLLCAVVLSSVVLFTHFHSSGPHAAEMSAVGHIGEFPPVW